MKTKLIVLGSAIVLFAVTVVNAQNTAFTYQGHLNSGGYPANGSYDFIFTLYTNSIAGSQIGNPYLTNAVPVSNGLFTASVDFGNVFNGTAYWLGISVRTNNTGSYSPLNPRQPITPTPYAIFANTASNLTGTASTSVNFSGTLSGDVTGTQSATVVSTVGGESAANVANGISAANGATSANNPNAIVERDGSGNFSAGSLSLSANLYLPTTSANSGIIYSGGSPLIHSYGSLNFFAGLAAGNFTTTGNGNVGIGFNSLAANSSGNQNIGIGYNALGQNTSGFQNVAIGGQALPQNTSGSYNTALGYGAGQNITTGSYNIDIGNLGFAGDNNTMRIGSQFNQTSTYIAGIYNSTVSGAAVYVNSSGQLGVLSSSEKYKRDIRPMCSVSDVLVKLKPVTFKYTLNLDPSGTPQFGLIAEQVEKVDPNLVVHDKEHGIYTVRYQAIDAMLLNEFLNEHKVMDEQSTEIRFLKQQNDLLTEKLNELEKSVEQLTTRK